MTQPTIIVDSREQTPLVFSLFASEVGTLQTGDYSLKGLEDSITIERKSIADLIGSLTSGRERFQREIQRMQAYRSRTLLIVGNGSDPIEAINMVSQCGNFRTEYVVRLVSTTRCGT